MATLAPPKRVKAESTSSKPAITSEQLEATLRPWRRRLTLQQTLRWTGGGIICGLILACLVLLISRLIPWATAPYWAMGMGIVCVLGAFAAALWYRPSLTRTTRLVDTRLSLHDRLGTAWEMRNETAPLYGLQRRDALKHLGKYTPQTSISLRPRRTSLIAFSIVLVILVLLVLLPNPMTAVLQQQAAFQARITKQIAAIDHLRTALAHQAGLSAQQHTQIDQILRDLEAKLHTVHTETEAQQAIAEAQAKLDALRDPQALNKIQARSAASSSLQSSPNANLNAVGQALSTNDSKGLHAALQSLANQVSKMTPQQRAQLARQVEQVANQASQDPNLKAALHQLAKAIADGNPSEISDAINSVEEAASQNATAQAQSNSIDQVSQGLQQIADDLTSYTDGTNQQGQNQGQGKGQAQGQGQGQNQNQQQGNGQGQGNGGRGGSGGHGVGGGKGNDTGSKSGKNEQVSIPGQIGSGSSTQSNDGNNGVVQKGNSVPYTQVIEQYDQMAHDAIDNSSISPDLKDLVHGYFNTLEGQ